MKRILLADDHAMMLEGLVSVLSSDYELVGTASDGRGLLEKAKSLKPDLIVLDVSMPEMNGIEAARQLNLTSPGIKLVFVTQQLDSAYVRAAFDAGAMGYVAKQSAGTELLEAVKLALQGRFYVTKLATQRDSTVSYTSGSKSNPAELFGGRLTPRQREVLQLVAEGKSTKEISSALTISVKTVEFHRNGLMNELGLRTTAELTRYALAQGVIHN